MISRVIIVVVAHHVDDYFADLVAGIRRYCPTAKVAWFDSSPAGVRPLADVQRIPTSRPMAYARVTPSFLAIFEWFANTEADVVINVETDAAFIGHGYLETVQTLLEQADYIASRYHAGTSRTSRWRPYRSLRPDLPALLDILGVGQTDQAFSPAQVFSRRYVETLLTAAWYPELRDFVADNQVRERSFTLQEVLLPTLVRALGLRALAYPAAWGRYIRYRPYLAASAIYDAASQGVPLVHPVRRDAEDPARSLVRGLARSHAQETE